MQIQGIQVYIPQTSNNNTSDSPFQIGDSLNATVEDVQGTNVSLRTNDGSLIVAKQQTMDPLKVGDSLSMQVVKNDVGGAVLQLMEVNGQSVQNSVGSAEMSLLTMQIPSTEASVAIMQALQDMGQPLTASVASRMTDIMQFFPDLTPQQSALLSASSIPLTQENVSAFISFLENPTSAATFFDALTPFSSALLKMDDTTGKVTLPQSAGEAMPQNLSARTEAFLTKNNAWDNIFSRVVEGGEGTARDILQFMSSLPRSATAADRAAILFTLTTLQSDAPAQSEGQQMQNAQTMPGDNAAAQAQQLVQNAQTPTLPSPSQAVTSMLLPLENATADTLLDTVRNLSPRAQSITEALIASGSEGRLLESVVQLGQGIAMQAQSMGEIGGLLYTQLPVRMNDTPRDAALYILKRDKGKNDVDEANTTVALCLDTENLGMLETLINVERDALSLQFRVEDEQKLSVVRSMLSEAHELDFPSRYRFTGAKAMLQKERITPETAGRILHEAGGHISPGRFDISI